VKPINANEVVIQTYPSGYEQTRKYPDFLNVVVTRPDLLPEELQNKIKNDTFFKDYRHMSDEHKGDIRLAIYKIRDFEDCLILTKGGMHSSKINHPKEQKKRNSFDSFCIYCCIKIVAGENQLESDRKSGHYACDDCAREHKNKGTPRDKERSKARRKAKRKLEEEAGENFLPKNCIRRVNSVIPFGYSELKGKNYFKRNPFEYKILFVCQQLHLLNTPFHVIDKFIDRTYKANKLKRRISKTGIYKAVRTRDPVEPPKNFSLDDIRHTCPGCCEIFYRPVFKTKLLVESDISESHYYCEPDCQRKTSNKREEIKRRLNNLNKDPEKGRVYVVTNSAFGDGWCKVGITTRNDDSRIAQYNMYDPLKRYKKVYERNFKLIKLIDSL